MLQTIKRSTLLIVTPQTPMTLPHALTLLRDMEECLSMPGIRDLALDLAEVKEADGTGLGVIVKMATNARASGQGFYLYRPSKEALTALNDMEVHGFFPILEYEEDLLAHVPD
ncbi:MAG: STAS domain-containing protein [Deltaproteobacteria bacterium]|jgi:anti-anti-sigma regulatory factor|nr:STAS domain-containing protein [Deltaproteobacteria bacterium]